jgi:hypothetical protein
MDAHQDLTEHGDLLNRIIDPTAAAVILTVLATPHLRNNFESAASHLVASLSLQANLLDTKNISTKWGKLIPRKV